MQLKHSPRPAASSPLPSSWLRTRRITRLTLTAAGLLFMTVLAACGGSFSVEPGFTPTSAAGPTATSTPTRFAYLYSRIDYPLQVAVDADDTVSLTLSPQSDILTVTPAPGQGTGTVGSPIPLPTDLQDYQDIAASVDTQATQTGAFTWGLISPERQSLLTEGGASANRTYRDSVIFKWQVHAVSEGQNTARIVLHLIFVYLDGSEHEGSIEVSQSPIPIAAVQTSALSIFLSQAKLPLAGVSGFAGIIAFIRYIYNAMKTISDVGGQVKGAVKVAQAVKGRVGGPSTGDAPTSPYAPRQPLTHVDDTTWPARRGESTPTWPGPQWPPLPSDPKRS